LLAIGLDREAGVTSTEFSIQIITNRFSTVVSASPQDNADICLLSSSIRSESVVPTGEAWENTKQEMRVFSYLSLVMTYKLCISSTTRFPVFDSEEHPIRRMIAYYGRGYQ
jgi:hypothetical protein